MVETGLDREGIGACLQSTSERDLARLHEDNPAPGPTDDGPPDPAVKRFRQMLGDGA